MWFAFVGFMFYWLQHYISRGKWVGFGDVKFGALLGVMLGIYPLIVCLFLAYIGGSIIALFLTITIARAASRAKKRLE